MFPTLINPQKRFDSISPLSQKKTIKQFQIMMIAD